MKLYLDRHRVQFVFAIFPSHYRIGQESGSDARSPGRLERIESLSKKIGISTINLLEPLRNSGRKKNELYLLPYDGHPSRLAYAIAAHATFEHLVESASLDPPQSR